MGESAIWMTIPYVQRFGRAEELAAIAPPNPECASAAGVTELSGD